MRSYTRRLLELALGLALCFQPKPALAQLGSVPYTFTSGTAISSSQVNTNFSTIYSNALLRTGGTMTGTLNARSILFTSDNTYDIGASGATRARDFFLARNAAIGGTLVVTGNTTLSGTAAITGNLAVNTNKFTVDASTGNTVIGGTLTSGTITATLSGAAPAGSLSGTTLASNVVTSSLTAVGTIATGTWNAGNVTVNGTGIVTITSSATPQIHFTATSGSTVDALFYQSGDSVIWGSAGVGAASLNIKTGGFISTLQAADAYPIRAQKHGTTNTIAGFYETSGGDGELRVLTGSAVQKVSIHSNAASYLIGGGLSIGDTTDPGAGGMRWTGGTYMTGATAGVSGNNVVIGTASVVRIGNGATITGIAGGVDGRVIYICGQGGLGGTVTNLSASSSAANRIRTMNASATTVTFYGCAPAVYSGVESLWLFNY